MKSTSMENPFERDLYISLKKIVDIALLLQVHIIFLVKLFLTDFVNNTWSFHGWGTQPVCSSFSFVNCWTWITGYMCTRALSSLNTWIQLTWTMSTLSQCNLFSVCPMMIKIITIIIIYYFLEGSLNGICNLFQTEKISRLDDDVYSMVTL